MTSFQPMIKIIPPNPISNSILIVYCYTKSKTIQCQAKWIRIENNQLQSFQNTNTRSMMNCQTGNTYKCTPLDCNHSILVEATCQFMNKTYKLTSKTQPVKPNKQLLQRKMHQKSVNCKIINSNLQVSCKIALDQQKTIHISSGEREFNLQLQSSHVFVLSACSFKCRILSHRFEFLTFLHQCTSDKQLSNQGYQLSLGNLFQFMLESQQQRDLVLLKIAQITMMNNEKPKDFANNMRPKLIASHQELPSSGFNFLEHAKINVELKAAKGHHFESVEKNIDIKKTKPQRPFFDSHTRTPNENHHSIQNKSPILFFNRSPKINQLQRKQSVSSNKKNQKIQISQKLSKKLQKQVNQDICSKSQNELKEKPQVQNINQKVPSILNGKKIESNKKGNQEYLDIFDQDAEMDIILQSSSPDFYSQNRSMRNLVDNKISLQKQKKDLPSINLRNSFQQMEKSIQQNLNQQQSHPKFQTQTCRQLGYRHPKIKQKQDFLTTPTNESVQDFKRDSLLKSIDLLKKENQSLKQQNFSLKNQLQSFAHLSKEHTNLKKKLHEATQKMTQLELEKKEILGEKLKFESFYNKEKVQKESLSGQLGETTKTVEQRDFHNLFKQVKQRGNLPIKADQIHNKEILNNGCQTLKNLGHVRPRYLIPQSRNRTPPSKIMSENQSLLLQQGNEQSNSQSRKQLRFPSYSHKLNTSNKNTTVQ